MNIQLIELNKISENNGTLTIIEESTTNCPFKISRVFHVHANIGSQRGKHAHKECSQLLICNNGKVEVECNNGIEVKTYMLDSSNYGLLIQPMIWSTQNYLMDKTILTVICSHLYKEEDYIRDFSEYLNIIKKNK